MMVFAGPTWRPFTAIAARAFERRLVGQVDCLVGKEEDLQKGLGVKGPEVTRQTESKLDPEMFFGMIEATAQAFPHVKLVATTLREVRSTNRHDWGAVLWLDGKK